MGHSWRIRGGPDGLKLRIGVIATVKNTNDGTTVNKLVKANRRAFYSRPADGRCHQPGYWHRGHRFSVIATKGLVSCVFDGATTALPQIGCVALPMFLLR